jgi:hypothetical protein
MFNTKSAHKMKPVLPVVTDIDIPPSCLKHAAFGFRIAPRRFVQFFPSSYAHIFRVIVLLFGWIIAWPCFATAIVVRYENSGLTVAADSKRSNRTPIGGGRVLRGTPVYVCKVCTISGGIFLAAGFADVDLCAIAREIANKFRTVQERAERFSIVAGDQIVDYLTGAPPNVVEDYTSGGHDAIQAAFIGIEQHRVNYALFALRARRGIIIPAVDRTALEVCPTICRPYFVLGSGAASDYVESDRIRLLSLKASAFVRNVIKETVKRDRERVGGKISIVTVDTSGVHVIEPGECPADQK